MNIVDRPELAPGHCIASLTAEDPAGFIDTGLEIPCVDPRVYVSVSWIKEQAFKLGFVEGNELALARQRVGHLETQLKEAKAFEDNVKYTLGKFGEEVRRKPGRPTKQAA